MPQVIFQLVLQIQIQFIQMKTSFFSKFQILNRGKSIVLELSIDLGRFHCTKEPYGLCAGSLLGNHHNDLSGIRWHLPEDLVWQVGKLVAILVFLLLTGKISKNTVVGNSRPFSKNIAIGTTDPRQLVLWLVQHLYFKAEAKQVLKSFTKISLALFGKGRGIHKTMLTNQCKTALNKSI